MNIIIPIPDAALEGVTEDQLRLLFRDALGEFIDTRTPADEYVARRYATHDPRFKASKHANVLHRVAVAGALHSAVSDLSVK